MSDWAEDEDKWRSQNDPTYPGYKELHVDNTIKCGRCDGSFPPDPNHPGYPDLHKCARPAPEPLDVERELRNMSVDIRGREFVPLEDVLELLRGSRKKTS